MRCRGSGRSGSTSCTTWLRRERPAPLAARRRGGALPRPRRREPDSRLDRARARRPRTGSRSWRLAPDARRSWSCSLRSRCSVGGGAARDWTRSTGACCSLTSTPRSAACWRSRGRPVDSRFELRVPCRDPPLRPPALPRGRPARAAARPLAAAGRRDRDRRHGAAAASRRRTASTRRTWLRRHGVHVVLRADRWRSVGRRGGLGGVADRLRRGLAGSIAPGLAWRAPRDRRGCRARRRAGAVGRPAAAIPRFGSLPPARGVRPERRARRRRGARARLAARPSAAGSGRSERSPRSPPTCSRSERSRR